MPSGGNAAAVIANPRSDPAIHGDVGNARLRQTTLANLLGGDVRYLVRIEQDHIRDRPEMADHRILLLRGAPPISSHASFEVLVLCGLYPPGSLVPSERAEAANDVEKINASVTTVRLTERRWL
jgi:hypothetical protein